MRSCMTIYRKQVRSHLHCCGSAKRRLTAKLDTALNSYLEENKDPSVEDLCTAFGPPESMAQLLMEALNDADKSRYRSAIIWKRIAVSATAVLLLVSAMYIFFIKQYHNITIVYEDTVSETYDIFGEE